MSPEPEHVSHDHVVVRHIHRKEIPVDFQDSLAESVADISLACKSELWKAQVLCYCLRCQPVAWVTPSCGKDSD